MIQITGRFIRIEMEVLEQWFWIWEENSFFDIKLSKVIADWCKIGCLDELFSIFARCCMDIFFILVKSTLLFIPVPIIDII